MLKINEIRELIRLLDETSLAELSVETEDMKFHIKKADPVAAPAVPQSVYVPPMIQSYSSSAATAPVSPEVNVEKTQVNSGVLEGLHIISSPMVGTFYRAPSPESQSYVEVGSKVQEKTVVCIIEAMKLMNEIEAEVNGEVVEILVENGQLVEYGQPLFRIRRA